MRAKIFVICFFVPILFSGGEPPPKADVVDQIHKVNRQVIELTKFVKYEMD